MENKKLIIYYEPEENVNEYIKSFSLSFSRINEKDGTYKQKAVLEHRSKTRGTIEEYKMKEFHTKASEILKKIEKINFKKEYSKPVKGAEYFCLIFGNEKIETSNYEEIKEILEDFSFMKLSAITHKHYRYIKDMNEYTKLMEILNGKISELNKDQLITLSDNFKNMDPYSIFQSMGWLPLFLDDIKKGAENNL